ncbi:MAG: hypothetical protein QXE20_05460 [Acidilobaceae archaeon]
MEDLGGRQKTTLFHTKESVAKEIEQSVTKGKTKKETSKSK